MRVLLFNDSPATIDALAAALKRETISVLPAVTPEHALRRLVAERPQAVVIAPQPEEGGSPASLALVREIRRQSKVPILLMGDQRDDSFVIRAYEEGIDAFVCSPCSPPVLAARLKALGRPALIPRENAAPIVHAQDFILDPGGYEVLRQPAGRPTRQAQVLPLTRTEFRLFYLLASNAGRVVSSARLAEYAAEARGRRGTIRVRQSMARLRQKLGLPHRGEGAIVAHPGVGYQYTGTVAPGTPPILSPAVPEPVSVHVALEVAAA